MRRFALIVLLSVFASFLGVDGRGAAPTSHAAFPGNNGKIAFSSYPLLGGVPSQIMTVNADGSDLRALADGVQPAWSPDGRRIAFTTNPLGLGDITVMNADGSGRATLTAGADSADDFPVWSPDGEQIAFIRGEIGPGTRDVWVMDDDGAGAHKVTNMSPGRAGAGISWSPDGTKILFGGTAAQEAGSDLFVVSPSGGGVTNLTNTPPVISGPDTVFNTETHGDWSPNGDKIAFLGLVVYGDARIYVMGAGGGARQAITAAATYDGGPSWSPDGRKIAYSGGALGDEIRIVGLDGSGEHALGPKGYFPDWQPVPATKVEFTQAIQQLQSISELQESLGTGGAPQSAGSGLPGEAGKAVVAQNSLPPASRILFVRPSGLKSQTFSIDGDGTNLRQITNHPESTSTPAWSPDGEKIAFFAYVDPSDATSFAIFTQSAAGGGATQVTAANDGVAEIFPHWSPRGDKIAYIAVTELGEGSTQYDAHVMNANGSADAIVALNAQPLAWSPDGSQIAYRDNPTVGDTLWVMNADGSGKRQISATKVGVCDWSPDGERLACHGVDGGVSGIKVISFATGVATTIKGNAHSPVWSPDGDEIAFSVKDSGRISIMDANGSNLRDLVEGTGPYDWIGPPVATVEFTQAIQQLQSISALQADLKGDGKPPVPIVAGKPAAMRVLFDQVSSPTTYDVEVSGEFNGSETVNLTPSCTLVQRRRQEAGCKSADFYFTPPQGNWSVTLRVKEGGTLVEEHEFHLTSVETDDIVLKAVGVCDSRTGGFLSPWNCQDPSPLFAFASLLRRVLPTSSVSVQWTGSQVRRSTSDFAQPIDWWGQVNRDLQAKYGIRDALAGLFGQETYYFGLTRTAVGGNSAGTAYVNTRGAASWVSWTPYGYEVIPWVVAHEMGHAMGRDHTNTAAPTLAGGRGCWLGTGTQVPPWPYADNNLRSGPAPGELEVGFDVESGTALPGDEYFEMMGYCSSPPPSAATPDITTWISPFTTMQLLEPLGPLGLSGAQPQAPLAAASGNFWFVRGTLDHESDAVNLEPLLQFNLEAPVEPGSGPYRIEVQNGAGDPLFARFFTPAHGHGSPSPGNPVLDTDDAFSELIPVQAGAASIAIIDDQDAEIGQIVLVGTAPSVSIALPATFAGTQTVSWSVTDPDSAQHTYWVDYSPDNGQTWQNQAMSLDDSFLSLDFDSLAGSSGNSLFRVIASDGVNSGEAVSAAFVVAGKAPQGEIIAPAGGSFREGSLVWLQSAAWDIDDGTLDDGAVTWSSSLDGALGNGASLPVYDLSVGSHTITMTARDSDNNAVSDTIAVSVFDGPIVEGGTARTWGDNDCSGTIGSRDVQALQKLILEQPPLTQTQPCPPVNALATVPGFGNRLWGDADCSGTIGSRDVQALQKLILEQLPLTQTQPCPAVGGSTTVAAAAALPASERRVARLE